MGCKVLKYSGLSPRKVKKTFLCFLWDITAAAAKTAGANPNTAGKSYNAICEKLSGCRLKKQKKRPESLNWTSRILARIARGGYR